MHCVITEWIFFLWVQPGTKFACSYSLFIWNTIQQQIICNKLEAKEVKTRHTFLSFFLFHFIYFTSVTVMQSSPSICVCFVRLFLCCWKSSPNVEISTLSHKEGLHAPLEAERLEALCKHFVFSQKCNVTKLEMSCFHSAATIFQKLMATKWDGIWCAHSYPDYSSTVFISAIHMCYKRGQSDGLYRPVCFWLTFCYKSELYDHDAKNFSSTNFWKRYITEI